MPILTTLNFETAFIYAHALAAVWNTTVVNETPMVVQTVDGEIYEFRFVDGTTGSVWLESGRVYGEA